MSFLFDIGGRKRKAASFITKVRNELLQALVEEKAARPFSQQQLAQKLGVNRSVINRQLNGEANLTLRTVADLAWALDREISFELKKRPDQSVGNYCVYHENDMLRIGSGQAPLVGSSGSPAYATVSDAKHVRSPTASTYEQVM